MPRKWRYPPTDGGACSAPKVKPETSSVAQTKRGLKRNLLRSVNRDPASAGSLSFWRCERQYCPPQTPPSLSSSSSLFSNLSERIEAKRNLNESRRVRRVSPRKQIVVVVRAFTHPSRASVDQCAILAFGFDGAIVLNSGEFEGRFSPNRKGESGVCLV